MITYFDLTDEMKESLKNVGLKNFKGFLYASHLKNTWASLQPPRLYSAMVGNVETETWLIPVDDAQAVHACCKNEDGTSTTWLQDHIAYPVIGNSAYAVEPLELVAYIDTGRVEGRLYWGRKGEVSECLNIYDKSAKSYKTALTN